MIYFMIYITCTSGMFAGTKIEYRSKTVPKIVNGRIEANVEGNKFTFNALECDVQEFKTQVNISE